MDEQLALAQLRALVKVPGALKIITSEIAPQLRVDALDPRSPVRPEALAADPNLLKKPSTFVLHDVVSLAGPNHKGIYQARSAEGDWTQGQASALLVRLQEWGGSAPVVFAAPAVSPAPAAPEPSKGWLDRILGR